MEECNSIHSFVFSDQSSGTCYATGVALHRSRVVQGIGDSGTAVVTGPRRVPDYKIGYRVVVVVGKVWFSTVIRVICDL